MATRNERIREFAATLAIVDCRADLLVADPVRPAHDLHRIIAALAVTLTDYTPDADKKRVVKELVKVGLDAYHESYIAETNADQKVA